MGTPLKIRKPLPNALFLLIILGPILSFGFGIGYFNYLQPLLESRSAQSWIETPCRVISSEFNTYHYSTRYFAGTDYSIDITYQYQVAGLTYRSSRYDFTDNGRYNDFDWVADVVHQNPVKSKSICFVDPLNPQRSVLNRSFKSSLMNNFIAIYLIVLPLLIFLYATWKQRSDKKAFKKAIERWQAS